MPIDPATAEALARGQALFNDRQFWEAHEEWENAWRVETGEVRLLLQGLIQIAAGWHHVFVTARTSGAVKLLTLGLEKLGTLPDDVAGLELEQFRRGVGRALDPAQRWARGECHGVDPAVVPRLERAIPRSSARRERDP